MLEKIDKKYVTLFAGTALLAGGFVLAKAVRLAKYRRVIDRAMNDSEKNKKGPNTARIAMKFKNAMAWIPFFGSEILSAVGENYELIKAAATEGKGHAAQIAEDYRKLYKRSFFDDLNWVLSDEEFEEITNILSK